MFLTLLNALDVYKINWKEHYKQLCFIGRYAWPPNCEYSIKHNILTFLQNSLRNVVIVRLCLFVIEIKLPCFSDIAISLDFYPIFSFEANALMPNLFLNSSLKSVLQKYQEQIRKTTCYIKFLFAWKTILNEYMTFEPHKQERRTSNAISFSS